MSPEVAALLGSGISGLVAGGIGLLGGFFWGRAKSDAEHADKRAEAWRAVSRRTSVPTPPRTSDPRDPTRPYTELELEELRRRALEGRYP